MQDDRVIFEGREESVDVFIEAAGIISAGLGVEFFTESQSVFVRNRNLAGVIFEKLAFI